MNPTAQLSKREQEVGKLIAWGACKKMVADRLYISIHTVENHVRNIFYKTGCRSANEFSAWYFCTHFNISMELSPLKNVVAAILLTIYLSGDLTQSFDLFTRGRYARRSNITERIRHRSRREDFELDYC
ncbi:MAG: helix-turn-helix transcriptional regulator [Paludibacter sp.]|nr:helix-turn-helix transcriptional regulator [Paludibacter sp.]MDD4429167.1 helix-turn-helix transcriptional regulator [Paludibacter sp.]